MEGRLWVYLVAAVVYVFSVWEHIPYGGGHIYSDIVSVFQSRFCAAGLCTLALPYVHVFVEYPVIVGMFIYSMASSGDPFRSPPAKASSRITTPIA